VARYLGEHFVAAHQQVGSFEVVNEFGVLKKNGGNVASYFCTPDGRVIHAITGPVKGQELMAAAQWAVEAYSRAGDNRGAMHEAHQLAQLTADRNGGQQQIHRLLAEHPLPNINQVFATIFQNILGQRISPPDNDLVQAEGAFKAAARAKLPILLILHKEGNNQAVLNAWNQRIHSRLMPGAATLQALASSYVVVALPLNEMPALSHQLKTQPYAAPDERTPLFIVTRSDGRQLSAVTTWEKGAELAYAMAQGVVQEAKEHPRSPAQLNALLRQVNPIDVALAGEVRKLMGTSSGARARAL